jgi:hypothetical protein
MKEIKALIKKLKLIFYAIWAVALLTLCAIEFDWVEVGLLIGAYDGQVEFVYQTLAIFITLGLMVLALRLLKYDRVKKHLATGNLLHAYQRFWLCRMTMLTIPMFFSIAGYWLFLNTSFLYQVFIMLIATIFVYPSVERMQNECEMETDKETDM